jgi:hypothetical protein
MSEQAEKTLRDLVILIEAMGHKTDVIETALKSAYAYGHFDGLVHASKVQS